MHLVSFKSQDLTEVCACVCVSICPSQTGCDGNQAPGGGRGGGGEHNRRLFVAASVSESQKLIERNGKERAGDFCSVH